MGFQRAVVVGSGGIASYLWSPLGRLLSTLGPKNMILVDGDTFEKKNMERQDMRIPDEKEFKADVLTRRVQESFPELNVASIPKFITEFHSVQPNTITVDKAILEGDLVFSCVDNHATRLLLSKRMQRFRNGILVSCGNEKVTGNVYRYIRINGIDITRPVERVHAEIASNAAYLHQHMNPGNLSCEERARRPGGEQTLACNQMAAAFAVVFTAQILALQEQFPGLDSVAEACWRKVGKVTEVQFDVATSTSVNSNHMAQAPRQVSR